MEKAAHPIPRITRKLCRSFLRDEVEEEGIIIVSWLLLERSWKEQVLVSRTTANKKANNSKPGNQEEDEEEDYWEDEDGFDDKNSLVSSNGFKEQAPFEEKVLFEWLRYERNLVDARDT